MSFPYTAGTHVLFDTRRSPPIHPSCLASDYNTSSLDFSGEARLQHTSMVLINEKKFACATCIKGHRVSGCTHTDRPLFEVKKKGRPATQCQHCRDKRKTHAPTSSVVHTKVSILTMIQPLAWLVFGLFV